MSNVSGLFLNSRILYLRGGEGCFGGLPIMTYMGRLCSKGFLFQERPLYVVFFFPPLEKKCLEIRKFAKFQSDLLKTNEDIARPQSREILQTFVWWGVGDSLGPSPPRQPPHHVQTSVDFRNFTELYRRTFKT